jgi:hypothetical protein
VEVEVTWTTTKEKTGWIELVLNGRLIARLDGTCTPSRPVVFTTRIGITGSSWICARRMNGKGHQSHTAPVYITVDRKPVRANTDDPQFFISWIDNLLTNIEPGNKWHNYVSGNYESIKRRYLKARKVYSVIAHEAEIKPK